MTVSLPDDVVAGAERFASREQKSLDELCIEAVREYIQRHDPDEITAAINRVEDELNEPVDEFVSLAARLTLERTEW